MAPCPTAGVARRAPALLLAAALLASPPPARAAEITAFLSGGSPGEVWGTGYGGMLTITLFNLVSGEIEGAWQGGDAPLHEPLQPLRQGLPRAPARASRPLRRTRRRRLPRVAAGRQRHRHPGPRLPRGQAQVPLRPGDPRGVPVGGPAHARPGGPGPPLRLRPGPELLIALPRPARGATLPASHGLPELHHDADDGEDRLLRSRPVRQDDEPPVDPQQDRAPVPR